MEVLSDGWRLELKSSAEKRAGKPVDEDFELIHSKRYAETTRWLLSKTKPDDSETTKKTLLIDFF